MRTPGKTIGLLMTGVRGVTPRVLEEVKKLGGWRVKGLRIVTRTRLRGKIMRKEFKFS